MQPQLSTVIGKVVEPKIPRESLYYSGVSIDKKTGAHTIAIAPRGSISPTGAEDKYTVLMGRSPMAMIPEGDYQSKLKSVYDYISHTGFLKDIVYLPRPKEMGAAMVRLNDMIDRETTVVTPGVDRLNMIFKRSDWYDFLDTFKYQVETYLPWPKAVEPRAVGLASALRDGGDGSYRIVPPKPIVGIKDMKIELTITQMEKTKTENKLIAQWQEFGVYCLKQMLSFVPNDALGLKNSKTYDNICRGFVAYIVGAYGGWDGQVCKDVDFTGAKLYDKILPYVTVPWSESHPDIAWDYEQIDHLHNTPKDIKPDAIRAHFMFNTWLGIACEEKGAGQTLPVTYTMRKGNVHLAKLQLERTLKPMLTPGGSDVMWMQPSTLYALHNGLQLPYVIENGREWNDNDKDKNNNYWQEPPHYDKERFTQTVVDRGVFRVPEADACDQNIMFQVTRDSFIDEFDFAGRQFLRVVHPIRCIDTDYEAKNGLVPESIADVINDLVHKGGMGPSVRKYRGADVTSFLLMYSLGGQTLPKYAVYVDPLFLDGRTRYAYSGGFLKYTTTQGERVALPGEVAPISTKDSLPLATAGKPQTSTPVGPEKPAGGQDVQVSDDPGV